MCLASVCQLRFDFCFLNLEILSGCLCENSFVCYTKWEQTAQFLAETLLEYLVVVSVMDKLSSESFFPLLEPGIQ